MNFRDMLEDDLNIFLNPDEFGETIIINDKEYTGVIEHPERAQNEEFEGIHNGIDMKIYIKYDKECKYFTIGKALNINNGVYIVSNSYTDEKLFVLELQERDRF